MNNDLLKRLGWGVGALLLVGLGIALMTTTTARPPANTGAQDAVASPSAEPLFRAGTAQAALHDYIEADFQGERLEGANWEKFKALVIWPVEPNWESAYVIRSYRLQSDKATAKEATIDVTYDTLGELDTETFVYTPSPTRQTVPYTMVPRKDAWRLGLPMLRPHVGPEGAIRHLERMKVNYAQYRGNIDQSIAALRAEAAKAATP